MRLSVLAIGIFLLSVTVLRDYHVSTSLCTLFEYLTFKIKVKFLDDLDEHSREDVMKDIVAIYTPTLMTTGCMCTAVTPILPLQRPSSRILKRGGICWADSPTIHITIFMSPPDINIFMWITYYAINIDYRVIDDPGRRRYRSNQL